MKRICKFLFSRYAICAFFILLDIAILVPSFWLVDRPELLYALSVLFAVFAIVEMVNRNISPEHKLTWIIVIVFLPYVGVVLYFLFSKRRLSGKEARMFSEIAPELAKHRKGTGGEKILALDKTAPEISTKVRAIINDDYLASLDTETESEYFGEGELMFLAMKRELSLAKRYIFLEYFIIEEGAMWDEILEILTERASQGVEVRVLYDDVGCMTKLPRGFREKLSARGISSAAFARVTPIATAVHNNRDHRKLMIIDGRVAFTGGVNIADEYIGKRLRFGHWKDGGVLIRGGAVRNMTELFLTGWDMTVGSLSDYGKILGAEPDSAVTDGGYYVPFGSGPAPIYRRPVGKNAFLNIINQARRYVYITTPYLIIDFDLTEALRNASLRGVDVRITTPGIADKKIVKVMTKSSYLHLMDAGVAIYEYTPGFIHEKLVVSDDTFAIVGTINFDYRSLVHHFENAVFMAATPTVCRIRDGFFETLAHSRRIDSSDARLGPLEWLVKIAVRVFAPLL